MANELQTLEEAMQEIEELRLRLEEAEESIEAIRSGEIDAVVVTGPEGEQIYTLTGAERTYRILVEAMNEGALVISPEGIIIYCNRTFAAMLDTPVYDVLGHSIYEFVADTDVEPLRHMLEYAPLRTDRREIELKHRDSGFVPTFVSVGNLETEEGQSISAVVTDLTEHKCTEAELEKYREHLEELVAERTKELARTSEYLADSQRRVVSILESINDAFIAIGKDWRFSYINDAAQRTIYGPVGRNREELIGKDIWQEFPELRETVVYECYSKAMFERMPVSFEVFYPPLDTWHGINVYPYEDGICAYIQDITERKQAEEEVREARTAAEQWAAQMESFVSSMADGVVLFDAEPKVLMVNDLTRQLVGAPSDMPAGVWGPQHELFTIDGNQVPKEDYPSARALRGEETKDARFRMVTPWRESLVSISGSPVRDAQGHVVGGTLSFRDASKQVELEQYREELYQRELHITEVLQGTLVPQDIPQELYGCKLAVKYQPALKEAEIGGDFFDVFDLNNGRIGIIIGDVAGKGLKAAMRVAEARYTMRGYAYEGASPAQVLTRANNVLSKGYFDEGAMLTTFFAIIDTTSNTVTYSNAGHEPPIVIGSDCSWRELHTTGLPLGVIAGVTYSDKTSELKPEDRVVMITDGISEARADGVVLFEKRGVIEYLIDNCDTSLSDMVGGLLAAATEHAGGHLQDDAAIVVFTACQEVGKE